MTMDGPRRLFDLTRGGHFTLLNFGAAATLESAPAHITVFHVIAHPTGIGEIDDPEGHLASAYGATARTLVLIRPDGYIGLICDAGDITTVSDYLAAIRCNDLALLS
jgi:hypothetical protein